MRLQLGTTPPRLILRETTGSGSHTIAGEPWSDLASNPNRPTVNGQSKIITSGGEDFLVWRAGGTYCRVPLANEGAGGSDPHLAVYRPNTSRSPGVVVRRGNRRYGNGVSLYDLATFGPGWEPSSSFPDGFSYVSLRFRSTKSGRARISIMGDSGEPIYSLSGTLGGGISVSVGMNEHESTQWMPAQHRITARPTKVGSGYGVLRLELYPEGEFGTGPLIGVSNISFTIT